MERQEEAIEWKMQERYKEGGEKVGGGERQGEEGRGRER